ncbi:hypothetical protein OV203_46155 [Nannocystis sp. ILAH1]|uniref:hypothetical protein n=1 Tax=unclassified Nannocystis TaxID=2627009 RepID=UPI00226DB6F7|nr:MULTISPECIES: hypothetical protein [unclassified Nannocystis]MCY0994596.1 hypothetical protein [Nannocystis sp. ILAH1]MCY1063138.1 hypothetical protein [Nannocystis sp. RBIL2]
MALSNRTTTRWLAAACAATLMLDPAIVRAQAPDPGIDSLQLRRDRGKKLLISGGVIGGVGLLATAIGFGVVAGMHASNPGVGKEFIFAPGQDERSMLRLANGMEMAGMVGASMLLTGIVLAAVGGHTLRQTRASRFSAGFGPRSVNLVFRF